MGNTQYFLLINNFDIHARSAKYHLSCNCDFVVSYSNIQRTNANIADNGDRTNSAIALPVVNQNPSQMFMIYISRVLNVMGLQIVKAWVINCSHVYGTTPSRCDIRLSNMSPGNKGCLSIRYVDPERLQLGLLHDWQFAFILWWSPKTWSLAWLCRQQNPHRCGHTW